ncbi:MMPL family transporter [Rubinisphaera sp.]|uniref:efflux RND transporter permease subunit n=1 Tax=Rubinisphaera sp. TaxID=2024857 RepID=UPI000C10E07A|nr:MMPL family transporter [Rubinisphaera sp.]MBV12312.1 hypothetical protein [Rubinisphaera sp.]HCS54548.1 hypothetical protein [Planctomycetaceae bacterium]|tara:strand:- start:356 stop:2647 length:2292 start_codon:yes stop_codon:yes gene_type:complete
MTSQPESISNDLPAKSPSVTILDTGFWKRSASFLIQWRISLLIFAVVLTAIAYPYSQRLQLDRSIESLFALDHPLLLSYQESKSLFGGDEFVMLAWKQDDLLTSESLIEIEAFGKTLGELPGVNPESTQTLSAVLRPKQIGFIGNLFMRIPTVRESALNFAEGALVGEDRVTTAVVVRLKPEEESVVSRAETLASIRDLAASHNPPAYVVGEPVQVHDMFEVVEKDGATLGIVSSVILLIVIFFFFRSLRWMILPLVMVQAALIWTKAFLVISGMRLSMVSSMLNSLVTIIGIATVMHITIYFRELRRDQERIPALRMTLSTLLPAICWACATTAIGFGALLSSDIVPIRSFGIMMVLGVSFTLLAAFTIIPGGVLLGNFSVDPRKYGWEKWVTGGLLNLLKLVFRIPKTIASVAFLLIVFGFFGLSFLRIETDFSKNFRDNSPIVQALNFVEANLGGAGNYEINFPFADVTDPEAIDKLRELSEELKAIEIEGHPALTKVIAYTDGIDFIPSVAGRTLEAKRETLQKMQPEFEPSLFNPEEQRMRILLRALERQPAELKLQMIDEVTRTAQKYFPEAKCTGLYVLLANIILSLLSDQVVSFTLAACGIFLSMTIAFRSWKVGLISLVPNLFPIVILIGTLGWIGSLVNIGTAMIASVSIGLTVDSSIHYLSSYFREKKTGHSHAKALELTQSQIGLSLVFSNVALICGFSVLMLSEFVPLIYFGVLVSIAMLGGLIGNLVLLPLLLTALYGRKEVIMQSATE